MNENIIIHIHSAEKCSVNDLDIFFVKIDDGGYTIGHIIKFLFLIFNSAEYSHMAERPLWS